MNPPGIIRRNDGTDGSTPIEGKSSLESSAESGPTKRPTVPDYELLRRIGHGAYGEVWLARSKATGVLRAAKIVWRRSFEDGRPFRREFEGIQRFERISREHPSQLVLFHIGRNEPAGYFYYVMELADQFSVAAEVRRLTSQESEVRNQKLEIKSEPPDVGCYTAYTLRAELEHGRLAASRVLEIGLALSEALSHLHSHGLVHRDVKPSNVIFVNGRPKLADIGLVTDASDQCSIVGTEGYLPPEGPGTPQADIFALGKVLYEAATGLDRREFPKLPDDLRSWPDAAQVFELNEIILKASAQDSRHRYQTCDELHADLALLGQGKSVKQKRTQQQLLAVAKKVLFAAIVFGVVAIGVNVFLRHSPATRPWSTNPQARIFYNRAVQDLESRAPDSGQRASVNLTKAVKVDSRFLDAYYLMFETGFHGNVVPGGNDRIAMKLEELAPESAQFHTVNSMIKFDEWSFDDAINEAKRAIKIDPNLMRTHGFYGWYLERVHGDPEAALQEYKIAEQIGPPDTIIQTIMADPYYMEHKFDLAIKQLTNAIHLDPNAPQPHERLAEVYEADKQYDKAIDEHEAWALLSGENLEYTKKWHQKMRSILHEQGPRGWWQAQLEGQKGFLKDEPYWVAGIYARLGDTNKVFSFLTNAYNQHDHDMINLLEDDHLDGYRGDPRFKQFLDKMGIHPISGAVRY
jgi:serine/threonine protein kinase